MQVSKTLLESQYNKLHVCNRTKYPPRIVFKKNTANIKVCFFGTIMYINAKCNVYGEIHFTLQSYQVINGCIFSIEIIYVSELSIADFFVGEQSVGEISCQRIFWVVGEISVGEMSVGEMSDGEMSSWQSVCRQNSCRRDFCRQNILIPSKHGQTLEGKTIINELYRVFVS